MLRRLWHRFVVGHDPKVWDQLPDGTPILGCPSCGAYTRRETTDPRPLCTTDQRFKMPAREQQELRHRAVRLLRTIRVSKERTHLRGIDGGKRGIA